jgi:lysozyme
MKLNTRGLAIIKEFEGLRTKAYRCPAGVWTIGYGHTSQAGPPAVKSGMTVTAKEAAAILAADAEKFAKSVSDVVKVALSDDQFSALVSFAYNVGIGNFRSSSVLKAVKARDFDAVPRRLALWIKAGGRVLPGLIKRRAAEAALFASHATTALSPSPGTIEPIEDRR